MIQANPACALENTLFTWVLWHARNIRMLSSAEVWLATSSPMHAVTMNRNGARHGPTKVLMAALNNYHSRQALGCCLQHGIKIASISIFSDFKLLLLNLIHKSREFSHVLVWKIATECQSMMADAYPAPSLSLVPAQERTETVYKFLRILEILYRAFHKSTMHIQSIICELCGMQGNTKTTMTLIRLMISKLETQVCRSPIIRCLR